MIATPGLRSGLRTMLDFAGESVGDRRAIAVLAAGKVLSTWSLLGSGVYFTGSRALASSVASVLLSVVGVRAGSETRELVRAESLADCQATAGSFFFDPDQPIGSADRYDDAVTKWDAAPPEKWDQQPRLYVHLSDGADPARTTVLAELELVFSVRGDVVPSLGPEKLANPGFESSSDGVTPEGWTIAKAGLPRAELDDAMAASGRFALALSSAGATAEKWDRAGSKWDAAGAKWDHGPDPSATASQVTTLRLGAWYLFTGRYRTAPTSGLGAYMRVGVPASSRWFDDSGILGSG